jgi:hypothetical protein
MTRFVTATARLAIVAALVAGCGGSGNDRAKVESSLRDYISGLVPEQGPFPVGAGPPRVRTNSCKDHHVTVTKGQGFFSRTAGVYLPAGTALWSCVVTFKSVALPVVLGTNGTKVVWATPGKFEQFTLK